jgi:UDP-N-acetylglucosamine 2-epimerase (non-hydrolysing)
MNIDLIVGARPNYMKVAPVYRALQKYPSEFSVRLIHTGQHYDEKMSDIFFRELEMPKPDIFLGVGSGRHGEQTGKIMTLYEKVLIAKNADLVLVVGDVNSTLACALTAVKVHIQVGHIEGGLRSRDWRMPEEINRVVTDRISDFLFTTCRDADNNLLQEGISPQKIHFVGNTMIDSLYYYLPKVKDLPVLAQYNLLQHKYVLVTLHRPSNVDEVKVLKVIFDTLGTISEIRPVLFPIHPRTKKMLDAFEIETLTEKFPRLKLIEPLGYLDFLKLQKEAALVLTDSGGIQEETTVLGIPCLTLRENTERPITVTVGTNEIVGQDPVKILQRAQAILKGESGRGKIPELWDGHSAERIVEVIRESNR